MSDTAPRRIRTVDFLNVFLRSFFIQAVWNYRSLLSVGFESCLMPVIQRLYPDPERRRDCSLRHLQFFNAHPYLVSFALGVSIRLEEETAAGDAQACDRLERVKELMITILGGLGDKLFWYTIRPFSLLVGVAAVLVAATPAAQVAVLIGVFFLYNIPHFYYRYRGIMEGYRHGLEIYKVLNDERFRRTRMAYRWIGVTAFAVMVAMLLAAQWTVNGWHPVVTLVAGAGTLVLTRKLNNFYLTVLTVLAVGLLIAAVWPGAL